MSNQSGLTGETASGYVVKIEIYEGPMDLLLKLIEKQELDITRVSLAAITDQYLIHLRLIEEVRPEAIVDFLVVAARLTPTQNVQKVQGNRWASSPETRIRVAGVSQTSTTSPNPASP